MGLMAREGLYVLLNCECCVNLRIWWLVAERFVVGDSVLVLVACNSFQRLRY